MASNGALYGIIGALGVVVVGGGLYIAKQEGAFGSADTTAAATAPPAAVPAPAPAPQPPIAAAPQPAPASPPPPPSNGGRAEAILVQQLVQDARRATARGDFLAADRALDQAERLAPKSSDVVAARRDQREAQHRASRTDDQRVDELVRQARAAIGRHDYVGAERLLNQAEQIDMRDNSIKQARAELANARLQADRESQRVDQLVAQARAAISRHDYATADRLLDQAENIDRRDRDVLQARAELNAAQRPNGPGRR
jgi:hypothetical protein